MKHTAHIIFFTMKIELLKNLAVGRQGEIVEVEKDLANYLIRVKGARAVVEKIDKTEGAEPKKAVKKDKPTKIAKKK